MRKVGDDIFVEPRSNVVTKCYPFFPPSHELRPINFIGQLIGSNQTNLTIEKKKKKHKITHTSDSPATRYSCRQSGPDILEGRVGITEPVNLLKILGPYLKNPTT